MSVDIEELHHGAIALGATATVTIATALQPEDRLVVALIKLSTTGTPGVSGLGTWTTLQAGIALRDHYLFTATGITGGGNITVSVGSSPGDYAVWVLRSSVGDPVDVHGSTIATQSGVASNVQVSTPAITGCDTGMMALGAGGVLAEPAATFPSSDSVPAAGWTTDRTGTNSVCKFLHQKLAAPADVRLSSQTSSSGSNHTTLLGVFTDGDSGVVASAFSGWGIAI